MINFTGIPIAPEANVYNSKLELIGKVEDSIVNDFPQKNWASISIDFVNGRLDDINKVKNIVASINSTIRDVGFANDKEFILGGDMPHYITAMIASVYGGTHHIYYLMEQHPDSVPEDEVGSYLIRSPDFKVKKK